MTLEEAILADLAVSQSTADSIAGRLKKATEHIETILRRLESENTIISFPITDRLLVYKLRPSQ
jgi:hypothetical protein